MNKLLFEKARVAWRENGGVVNGFDPEYENLVKVCKKYRLKIAEVIPLLLPAIETYFAFCNQRKADKVFCEPPSSFTVFTNNRRWLREYPHKNKPQPKRCRFCDSLNVAITVDGKGSRCGADDCRDKFAKL